MAARTDTRRKKASPAQNHRRSHAKSDEPDSVLLGIDIGGTFTDICLLHGDGRVQTYKTASTPEEPLDGVLEGIRLAAGDSGLSLRQFLEKTVYFGHGTTIATNALIQRSGARVGLITTRGFRDTILIQRSLGMTAGLTEEELADYSLRSYPEPLVPPGLIKEVSERVDYKGSVVVDLNLDEAKRAVDELIESGVQSIAVCFLWSFLNPVHERAVRDWAEARGAHVTASSDLFPILGEYERTASTVMNAYLSPIVKEYLNGLERNLKSAGLRPPPVIMHSAGGSISPEEAAENALTLLMSGPAGGVIGSRMLGEALGHDHIITADMGGTSFDVGLIVNGEPVHAEGAVFDKYHTLAPMMAIETIGAGGGSMARVIEGELLVGPESAGAVPGPACYKRGGTEPTATDADAVLGILNPAFFLGGRIPLAPDRALQAIESRIAKPLGLSALQAAAGIRQIIDQQMADLIRRVTLERGFDPQDFVLYAYGGAGPAHCASFGKELNISEIVMPLTAGSHSAFGAVASDIQRSFALSHLMRTPPLSVDPVADLDARKMETLFRDLEDRGRAALRKNGIPKADMEFHRFVHMRYRRQTHEVPVPVPNGRFYSKSVRALMARFEEEYETRYGGGSQFPEAGLEITTFRVEAVGRKVKPNLQARQRRRNRRVRPIETKNVYYYEAGGRLPTKFYRGADLPPGMELKGPAVLEYAGTTILIEPGQTGCVDPYLNVRILL